MDLTSYETIPDDVILTIMEALFSGNNRQFARKSQQLLLVPMNLAANAGEVRLKETGNQERNEIKIVYSICIVTLSNIVFKYLGNIDSFFLFQILKIILVLNYNRTLNVVYQKLLYVYHFVSIQKRFSCVTNKFKLFTLIEFQYISFFKK